MKSLGVEIVFRLIFKKTKSGPGHCLCLKKSILFPALVRAGNPFPPGLAADLSKAPSLSIQVATRPGSTLTFFGNLQGRHFLQRVAQSIYKCGRENFL